MPACIRAIGSILNVVVMGENRIGMNQTIIPGVGTEQLGLVLWLDRAAVIVAIENARTPAKEPEKT